jgi:hypothetical protein
LNRKILLILSAVIFPVIGMCGYLDMEMSNDENQTSDCDATFLKKVLDGVENREPDSLFKFGQMHYLGVCVPKNEKSAFNLFLEASEYGHITAYYNLALMLDLGIGVDSDRVKSAHMLKKLLEIDFEPAQNYICILSEEHGYDMDSIIEEYSLVCDKEVE